MIVTIPAQESVQIDIKELDALMLMFNAQLAINADVQARLTALEGSVTPPDPPTEPPIEPPDIPGTVDPPLIPVPPSDALHTKDFAGDDLGARINAAVEKLGDREGAIIVAPGTIATQVKLRPKQSLYFEAGRFPIVNPSDNSRLDFGAILPHHHGKIFGQGERTQLIEPPEFGYIVIQAARDIEYKDGHYDTFVTEDLELAHFSVIGANQTPEGGRHSTIQLGNAHGVKIHHVGLRDTSCLGITAGGTALDGNHAEDWQVRDCLFEGVASQTLNVVNGQRVIFEDNAFLKSGKWAAMGMTAIDLEPNTDLDIIRDIIIRKNLVDSTSSIFNHGNGILVQNTTDTRDYGPVLVEDNRVIGGGNIFSGIYVTGIVSNVQVRRNYVDGVLHSLYRFENGTKLLAEDNEGIGRGKSGASEAIEVEVSNVTHSRFARFKLKLEQAENPDPNARMRIEETGNSDFNEFDDCTPEPTLKGKHSKIK